ncbi:MAG: helix-turn-helix transcriptional regulator [Cytophagales bacterium]|nr:helix-turn-helix transcriptional regulator [Cytophagales bacterium]
MLKSRKHIELHGRTIIEKLQVIPPLRQSPVFQDEACFLFFSEGGSEIAAPSEKVHIHEHEGVLLKCGTYFADLFANGRSGQCEVCVIHFFPDILQDIFKGEVPYFVKENKNTHYTQRIAKKDVFEHFIESLDFYFEQPELVNQEILYLKIKELILLLLHTDAADSIIELYSHLFTPQKASITEVIETHLFSQVTLEQLASLASLSLSSFKREFKKHFKETPAQFIRNRRLQKAKDLLVHSSLSISEISFQVGYEDSSYFSRLFSSNFMLSPSEFRKSKQKLPTSSY